MKAFAFVFILILSATHFAYTQNNKNEIEIQHAFGGTKYSIDGKQITPKNMMQIMHYDEFAYAQIKSGRAYNTAATILAATGGVLIGLNVGFAIAENGNNDNNEVKWGMAIAGGVLVLITIPISITGTKRINNAVEIHNANLASQSFHKTKPEFRIGFTGTGLGMILKF
jgi:hypothetical protein